MVRCPKCAWHPTLMDSRDWMYEYRASCATPDGEEHVKVTCPRCSYSMRAKTADSKEGPRGQEEQG